MLNHQLWAIDAASLSSVQHRLAELETAARSESKPRTASPIMSVVGGTAVVGINGPIIRGLGTFAPFASLFGICSQEAIFDAVTQAESDPSVSKIQLNIDSPGGSFTGIPELGNLIESCSKATSAEITGMGCSAAFWIGCACDKLTCSVSSSVGSIGVLSVYVDSSAAMTSAGLKQTIFRKPALKAPGSAGESLSPEQKASIEKGIDAAYSMFSKFIQKRRPNSPPEAFTGESWLGGEALRLRLVDAMTGTQGIPTRSGSGSSATAEASLEAQWNADPALRDEFLGSFTTFAAYQRNRPKAPWTPDPIEPAVHLDLKAKWDADKNLREEFRFNFRAYQALRNAEATQATRRR